MSSLDKLRILLATHCTNNKMGFGVELAWLIQKLNSQILAAGINIPVQTSFQNIFLQLRIQPSDIAINESGGIVTLDKFKPVIDVVDGNGEVYNSVPLSFEQTEINLKVVDGIEIDGQRMENLRISWYRTGRFEYRREVSTPNNAVMLKNGYSVETYEEAETKIFLGPGIRDFLDSFISTFPFPKVIDSLQHFKLGQPYSFIFEDGYALVLGRVLLNSVCFFGENLNLEVKEKLIEPNIYPNLPKHLEVDNTSFKAEWSRTISYKKPILGPQDCPIAVFFPKQITWEFESDRLLKPGLAAGEGDVGFFYEWFWEARVSLNRLKVDINVATGQIFFQCELLPTGVARAAVGIGCIKFGHTAMLGGTINLELKSNIIAPTGTDQDVNFVTSGTTKLNLNLQQSMPVWLLQVLTISIATAMTRKIAQSFIDKLNFKLIDLSEIRGITAYRWQTETQFMTEAVVIGLKETNG